MRAGLLAALAMAILLSGCIGFEARDPPCRNIELRCHDELVPDVRVYAHPHGFLPENITLRPGQTVQWTAPDCVERCWHDVTFAGLAFDDRPGYFDAETGDDGWNTDIDQPWEVDEDPRPGFGDRAGYTLRVVREGEGILQPGTLPYFCSRHPWMQGNLTIGPETTAGPAVHVLGLRRLAEEGLYVLHVAALSTDGRPLEVQWSVAGGEPNVVQPTAEDLALWTAEWDTAGFADQTVTVKVRAIDDQGRMAAAERSFTWTDRFEGPFSPYDADAGS